MLDQQKIIGCIVAQYRVHCGSVGYSVAQLGCSVAQLGCSVAQLGCSVAQLGCSVSQLVVRWLSVRQARVRVSARHPTEVPPTEPTAVKLWRWASANVCEWMTDVWMYLLYERKINAKKLAYGHQTLQKNYNYKYKNFRDTLTVHCTMYTKHLLISRRTARLHQQNV